MQTESPILHFLRSLRPSNHIPSNGRKERKMYKKESPQARAQTLRTDECLNRYRIE